MTAGMSHDCIAVRNPVTVRDESIPVDRIPLGVPGDYKPCIAQLPGGELILTAFHQVQLGDGKIREDIILYRSSDGGLTWSDREVSDLLGREPYFSVARDGTLFITVHLLPQDVRNERGSIHSYIHRSGDRGRTWETTPILSQDIAGAPDDAWALTSRNVLELDDGALLLGVSAPEGHDLLWRSTDGGMNWGSHPCAFEGVEKSSLWWPFWAETILWQASNGDVLGLFRVDHRVFPLASAEPPGAGDQYERMILFRSRDGGATWSREPDLKSVYGEMYPSVIRLSDGRLLMTFTVRDLNPPLGVHAVFGVERDDGFTFAFDTDRLVIDAKTPLDSDSGGGFGPTVQLEEGTLVTSYSYRGVDRQPHMEIARWQSPTISDGGDR